jgi:hypothetical protein
MSPKTSAFSQLGFSIQMIIHHLICHLNSFEVNLCHNFPVILQLQVYPPVIKRGLLENHPFNHLYKS